MTVYYLLFGVIVQTHMFGAPTISVPTPLVFKTREACIETLEKNRKDFVQTGKETNLRCELVEVMDK